MKVLGNLSDVFMSGVFGTMATYCVLFVMFMVVSVTRTPGVDDCVPTYAGQLLRGEVTEVYIYQFKSGQTHVDSDGTLPIAMIGKTYGCLNVTGHAVNDVVNTIYCQASMVTKKISSL